VAVHIYTQTIPTTSQLIQDECGLCPVFASFTLAFALQLREKLGKTLVRVAEEFQLARVANSATDTHQQGPNNICSHTTELTTPMYFDYFKNSNFSKLE
jgi:hypothetical protein